MKALLSGDLHLTEHHRDYYRFELFDWLYEQASMHDVDAIYILGDITDRKDRHSAKLVNLIVERLLETTVPVFILRGNHDGVDPNMPFFKFLNNIPRVTFAEVPVLLREQGVYMIPHQRTQAEFDAACAKAPSNLKHLMLHQTFDGSEAETGSRLSGLSLAPVSQLGARWVWAGDVHKPQQCGPVRYLGAPYHVRFGDTYKPTVTLFDNGKIKPLHFPAPSKRVLTITDPTDLEKVQLVAGDQVKLRLNLTREEVSDWPKIKRDLTTLCQQLNVELHGINMSVLEGDHKPVKIEDVKSLTEADVFKEYCKAEKLSSAQREIGESLLNV